MCTCFCLIFLCAGVPCDVCVHCCVHPYSLPRHKIESPENIADQRAKFVENGCVCSCLKHDDGQNGHCINRQLVFFSHLASFFSFSFVSMDSHPFFSLVRGWAPVSAHACLVQQQQEKGAFRIQETDGNILPIPDCMFRMIGRRQFDGLFFPHWSPHCRKTHATAGIPIEFSVSDVHVAAKILYKLLWSRRQDHVSIDKVNMGDDARPSFLRMVVENFRDNNERGKREGGGWSNGYEWRLVYSHTLTHIHTCAYVLSWIWSLINEEEPATSSEGGCTLWCHCWHTHTENGRWFPWKEAGRKKNKVDTTKWSWSKPYQAKVGLRFGWVDETNGPLFSLLGLFSWFPCIPEEKNQTCRLGYPHTLFSWLYWCGAGLWRSVKMPVCGG